MCNSTNFFRLTLSQYGKAFSLSATPVAYLLTSGINTPLLEAQIAEPSVYLNISKIGSFPNLYHF